MRPFADALTGLDVGEPGRSALGRGSVMVPDQATASEVPRGRWAEFRAAAAEAWAVRDQALQDMGI